MSNLQIHYKYHETLIQNHLILDKLQHSMSKEIKINLVMAKFTFSRHLVLEVGRDAEQLFHGRESAVALKAEEGVRQELRVPPGKRDQRRRFLVSVVHAQLLHHLVVDEQDFGHNHHCATLQVHLPAHHWYSVCEHFSTLKISNISLRF